MTHPSHPPAAESSRQRIDRAEAIKQEWRVGRPPDAATALEENPDIAADRAVALDLAYEEFCTRQEAGEVLDSAAFCARFPFGASLRRLLTLHRFLDEHPDALDGAPAHWPVAGEAVGDFLLLRELGRGSFSRVYLALETTAGDRPVVLKVSAAGSREADTLGPLSHPHLIPVLSSRQVGTWNVVAMPFAGTATLEDALPPAPRALPRTAAALLDAAARGRQPDDPPFPSSPAFPVTARMAYGDAVGAVAGGLFAAVAYLHSQGIAHRDIKPSNVLLGPSGHPYLLDFNLASRVTDPWRLVGTLPYMAPEQLALVAKADATPPADGRPADVFACGVVLFELLTGRHPFRDSAEPLARADRAQVAAELLAAQRAGHPALASLNPRVRSSVARVVERCLALDPRERPTAAELAVLFSRRGPRRELWLAAATFALAGAGVLALTLSGALSAKPVPAPEPPPAVAPVTGPAAPTTPFDRGLTSYRAGEYRAAAADFINAGKAERDGRAYAYAAYCLSVEKESVGALAAANEAIRRDYRTAAVYANRAYNHFQNKQLAEAKEDCDEAIRLDPDLVAPRWTRALTHFQLYNKEGKPIPPEALADIERVTAAAPNVPDVWLLAAQLYLLAPGGSERHGAAAAAVKRAIGAGKDPAAIQRNKLLSGALADSPDYKRALQEPRGPVSPPINLHLANPIP